MQRMRLAGVIRCGLAGGLAVLLAAAGGAEDALPPPAERKVDFVKDIQPLLSANCLSCHGPAKSKGNLRLDSRDSVRRNGVVHPGHSADSPLVQRIAGLAPEGRMPPKGPGLTPKQIALVRAWIDQGAVWPEVADAGSASKDHWAYRRLHRPAVPAVKDQEWGRTPIDAFILAALEARGMKPSPEADRRTLLRRVRIDLTGLPPTPEEIDAFLDDTSPDAYEAVVDRLLASPDYGERWARHWMDVIHYAETHGNDQDVPRENAWPYRDYLIRSLNSDKSYARFVSEQVAGDVLFPESADGVVATGFLTAGPWDESSQKDIRDNTLDKVIAQTLDRDDMVTTVFSSICSTTIQCARCHDHKFDPFSQQEYYALQAVFAGVDRAERPFDADPVVARVRADLLRQKKELDAPLGELRARLLSPEAQARSAAWEKELHEAGQWTVLHPRKVTTAAGSVPTVLPDESIRFGGRCPETDTYQVEARTNLAPITAIRLEVLTDDSLPHRGPGRQDNGNLHLSEFRVEVAPAATPSGRRPVLFREPSADFNQAGWTIAMAIDGNLSTAWGIYPEVGKPHEAVFPFQSAINGHSILTVTLEQKHGGRHLIGRLRLSVTTAANPGRVVEVPSELRPILALPAEKRTDAQKMELARHALRDSVDRELAALPKQQRVYAAANDFPVANNFRPARRCRPINVLRRGDVRQPQAPALPAAPACVPGLDHRFHLEHPENEGERRAALARWLIHRDNVLTWRSIVNRVWHYHFGRGIVATPSDLGHMGARPTHPELLDWLAVWFRDDAGGSLKQLHRLIVTSAAYRQASVNRPDCAARDDDNLLLWRMNRGRLDAESVRDAVLLATGDLDRTMGGPSVKHFIQSPGIHVTPKVDYATYDLDSPGAHRRSIYRFLFRTLPDPFMDAMDCPDGSQLMPVRPRSETALQALAMLNDRFILRQSEHFAARVAAVGDLRSQVREAFRLAFGRLPAEKEAATLSSYAARHGMVNVCRLLFNSNEFLFVP
jgi:hypothetical protein